MKLVSSSPEPRHTHRVRSDQSWFWKRLVTRGQSAKVFGRMVWLLLVVIVGAFAIAIFHYFRQTMEAVAGQQ